MDYNKLIFKIKKNKYQNYLNLNKNFYISYIVSRLDAIDKLENKKILSSKKFLKPGKNKIFHTFSNLYLMFDKFKKTYYLTENDLNTIFILYKKFETNLILRESYSKNFFKVSKRETNLSAYILLGFFIKKLKNINSIQKINALIKINDHLILNEFNPGEYRIKKVFIKNINYEIAKIHKLN